MEDKNITQNSEKIAQKDFFKIKDAEGERFFVRDGFSYREVTSPKVADRKNFHKDKRYSLNDVQSFIDYCKKYGDEKTGVIFFNPGSLVMYFNEENREEFVLYKFALSQELMLFLGREGKGKTFTQKDFYKCLTTYPESVEPKTITPKIKSLKISSEIEIHSEIGDTDHTFLYKEKSGKQSCSIPKNLNIVIPYFENSKHNINLNVSLEIIRPQSAEEKVMFVLENTYFNKVKTSAITQEIDYIKSELPGWNFFNGQT